MKELYLESLHLKAYQTLEMAIFIKNIKSQYVWANDFFIKKSAGFCSTNEIVNKEDYDFIWHDYADELRGNDQLLFQNAECLNAYERIVRYEGTYVDIITKKCLLYDNNKKIIGLIGFSIEIPASPTCSLLSKREYAAVLLMSEGNTDKQIAKKLSISPRTVESHIINAKRKLGVTSRAELIANICRGIRDITD